MPIAGSDVLSSTSVGQDCEGGAVGMAQSAFSATGENAEGVILIRKVRWCMVYSESLFLTSKFVVVPFILVSMFI